MSGGRRNKQKRVKEGVTSTQYVPVGEDGL